MRVDLPKPEPQSYIYKDRYLYACLASHPIARGHVVIVWKKNVRDIHLLNRKDYDHLMDIVNAVRNAMIIVLKIQKVYLVYMDETQHVHWHLVPRYNEKGYDVFMHRPKKLIDYSLAHEISAALKL